MISVIIPNYNHSLFFEERINSVLSQTYSDFEIIILDDCSTDNSREIINRFRSHPKVSAIVFNEKNSGSTFKQWKKGIELAKGEFIWIAESDDWCEGTFLENLIQPLLQDPAVVLSYCSSLIIRDNKIERTVISSAFFNRVYPGTEWRQLNLLDKVCVANASAAVFRKSSVDISVFDYIQEYKLIGDRLFWFELAECGNVYTTAKFLNYFRYHQSNVTENKNREGVGFVEYIDFLKLIRSRKSFNAEVELHLQSKITNSFLFMEDQKIFLDHAAQVKVFDSINEFLPNFKNTYWKQLVKQKLYNGKRFLLNVINRIK